MPWHLERFLEWAAWEPLGQSLAFQAFNDRFWIKSKRWRRGRQGAGGTGNSHLPRQGPPPPIAQPGNPPASVGEPEGVLSTVNSIWTSLRWASFTCAKQSGSNWALATSYGPLWGLSCHLDKTECIHLLPHTMAFLLFSEQWWGPPGSLFYTPQPCSLFCSPPVPLFVDLQPSLSTSLSIFPFKMWLLQMFIFQMVPAQGWVQQDNYLPW